MENFEKGDTTMKKSEYTVKVCFSDGDFSITTISCRNAKAAKRYFAGRKYNYDGKIVTVTSVDILLSDEDFA